jgi:hypothetical protein
MFKSSPKHKNKKKRNKKYNLDEKKVKKKNSTLLSRIIDGIWADF